jgi:hypothetical protein
MDMSARALLCFAIVVAACGGGNALASPTPAPSPLPTAEVKYRVMDAGGRVEFCDPDFYPIARADEEQLAKTRIGDIQKDAETYGAITKRVGTDTLAVYREWKALNALRLEPLGNSAATGATSWGFAYRSVGKNAGPSPAPKQGPFFQVEGHVDVYGKVDITKNVTAGAVPCPICLALHTLIATPHGDIAVEDLRVGDVVWTIDGAGHRVAAALVEVGKTPVPSTHEVVVLALDDGRAVRVSPGHPTSDGRRIGDLRLGDELDGSQVRSAAREPYAGGFTFDVLPASESRAYWANGILLRSTIP